MADQDQSPDHACDTEVKAKELEPEEDGKPADVHVAPGDTMLMDSQSVYINIAPPIIVQNGKPKLMSPQGWSVCISNPSLLFQGFVSSQGTDLYLSHAIIMARHLLLRLSVLLIGL